MKKFTIQIGELREAVKKLQQAVPSKSVLPSTDYLLVQKKGNEVTFVATDLELTIFYRCPVEGGDDCEFLIPFADLKHVVGVVFSDITFAIDDKDEVSITSLQDHFNFGKGCDIGEFPKVNRIPKKNHIELNGTLVESMNAAMLTVGKDSLRPVLSNILLDFKKDTLKVVSTDAYLLYTKEHNIKCDFKEKLQISPKIAKALEGFIKTTIFFNEQSIAFESEQITVITKRHEDKYPNYQAVIRDHSFNATTNRFTLEGALSKCCIIDEVQKMVVFTLGAEQFDLEIIDKDTAKSAKTMVTGNYSGEVGNIALNGKKLLTLLQQLPKEVENLRLSIEDASKAVLLSPEGDDSILSLIMPINNNQ